MGKKVELVSGTISDYTNCVDDLAKRPEMYSNESMGETLLCVKKKLCEMGEFGPSKNFSYGEMADDLRYIRHIERVMHENNEGLRMCFQKLTIGLKKHYLNES